MRLQSDRLSVIEIRGLRHLVQVLIAFFVVASVILLFPSKTTASAANIFLAQTSTGAANGADCNDAFAYTFFNSSANWGNGANQIGAGTTVHLCGTINVSAGANAFTFQGSGTSGNLIALKWETGAILQAPFFGSGTNGAINANGQAFLLMDGGSNGILQNSLNGTPGGACPGGACSNQQGSMLVWMNCHDCEIKNLTVGPVYVRTSLTDTASNFNSDGAIFFDSSGGQAHSNVTIDNNTIHDGRWLVTFNFGSSGSNLKIFNNQIFNMDHGMVVAGQSTIANYDGVYIFGNHIYHEATWDDASGSNTYHHDGIHMFAGNGSSATTDHVYIYNNDFNGPVGGQSNGNGLTAHVYLEPTGGVSTIKNGAVFNNVLTYSDGDCANGCGNGQLGIFSGSISMVVANNTMIGNATNSSNPLGVCAADNQPTLLTSFVNNVVTTCQTLDLWGSSGSPLWLTGQPDYNIYANSASLAWKVGGSFFATAQFSSYRSAAGNETHSAYQSSAGLAACASGSSCTPTPQSGSPTIGAGTNLFSTCNGQPNPGLGALCFDKAGNSRPSTGPWDVGALASGVTVNQPAPPTNLAAAVQ